MSTENPAESDFEIGQSSFNSPVKIVPARKFTNRYVPNYKETLSSETENYSQFDNTSHGKSLVIKPSYAKHSEEVSKESKRLDLSFKYGAEDSAFRIIDSPIKQSNFNVFVDETVGQNESKTNSSENEGKRWSSTYRLASPLDGPSKLSSNVQVYRDSTKDWHAGVNENRSATANSMSPDIMNIVSQIVNKESPTMTNYNVSSLQCSGDDVVGDSKTGQSLHDENDDEIMLKETAASCSGPFSPLPAPPPQHRAARRTPFSHKSQSSRQKSISKSSSMNGSPPLSSSYLNSPPAIQEDEAAQEELEDRLIQNYPPTASTAPNTGSNSGNFDIRDIAKELPSLSSGAGSAAEYVPKQFNSFANTGPLPPHHEPQFQPGFIKNLHHSQFSDKDDAHFLFPSESNFSAHSRVPSNGFVQTNTDHNFGFHGNLRHSSLQPTGDNNFTYATGEIPQYSVPNNNLSMDTHLFTDHSISNSYVKNAHNILHISNKRIPGSFPFIPEFIPDKHKTLEQPSAVHSAGRSLPTTSSMDSTLSDNLGFNMSLSQQSLPAPINIGSISPKYHRQSSGAEPHFPEASRSTDHAFATKLNLNPPRFLQNEPTVGRDSRGSLRGNGSLQHKLQAIDTSQGHRGNWTNSSVESNGSLSMLTGFKMGSFVSIHQSGDAYSVATSVGSGGGTLRSSKETNKPYSRQEFVETPRSKAAYKDFYRVFREKEKESFQAAKDFALATVNSIFDRARWRVYLELADLCKRNNMIQDARIYYSEACSAQPRANMGWLEWSKMEEENGKLRRALNILILGLKVCRVNEALLTRVIKLHERLHKYKEVRGMLSSLRNESIDRVWKSMLEGSLFEARAGEMETSRTLFRFLMKHVSWYGPIYYEAFRLEEKACDDAAALSIIRQGLSELPRYGPLWFGLLRIMERKDLLLEQRQWCLGQAPIFSNLRREAQEAVKLISKELTWKIYFEVAQAEERAAEIAALGMHQATRMSLLECRNKMLGGCRKSLLKSLMICPGNLRWRILLVGSRLESGVGAVSCARDLLFRAFAEVPTKSKSFVFLECSRLEEFVGNVDAARFILTRVQEELPSEWKVFLESVLLEARAGRLERAARIAAKAVRIHPGTGRLWSIYIQLCHRLEFEQSAGPSECPTALIFTKEWVLRHAIAEVPKSGEVWCERGRCHMNPLNLEAFDLTHAQRSLCFAIQFTPQYGDTFIEYVRLEMICQVLLPRVFEALQLPLVPFLQQFLCEDLEADLVDFMKRVLVGWHGPSNASTEGRAFSRKKVIAAIESMTYDFRCDETSFYKVSVEELKRRCVNADPNYGSAWFHCRKQPFDVPFYVMDNALKYLAAEFSTTCDLYCRAILRFIRKCLEVRHQCDPKIPSSNSSPDKEKKARPSSAPLKKRVNTEQDSSFASSESSTPHVARSWDSAQTIEQYDRSFPDEQSRRQRSRGIRKEKVWRNSPVQDDRALELERVKQQIDDRTPLQVDLERSVLQDFQSVGETSNIPVLGGAAEGFCHTDFVTGLIEMNRSIFSNNLSDEVKRKVLFSSDQIVS